MNTTKEDLNIRNSTKKAYLFSTDINEETPDEESILEHTRTILYSSPDLPRDTPDLISRLKTIEKKTRNYD